MDSLFLNHAKQGRFRFVPVGSELLPDEVNDDE
jgi:hypothetical protein